MQCYSTKNKSELVTLKTAVLKGMPNDGGLYMPAEIPGLQKQLITDLSLLSFQEIAYAVLQNLLQKAIDDQVLKNIITAAFNFKIPIKQLNDSMFILELFHGPTCAFKDFAARFMSRLMEYYVKDSDKELTILVATSGDTGSAVAHGFHKMKGINVIILYPSGMVSELQEKQLTTIGDNITALEINGAFDDCQKLVKQTFVDKQLTSKFNLSSANSINIARLIPQTLYYFYAFAKMKSKDTQIVISVPCGNFGNLTAGLMAKKMGLPITRFIASLNSNDVFQKYLKSGIYKPQKTKKTISNAMDVGNPSNFQRILDLYNHNLEDMRRDISSFSFTDIQTKNAIQRTYSNYSYILDPHGAVAFLGLEKYFEVNHPNQSGIIFETAHPAKFNDIVQPCINKDVEIPEQLKSCLTKEKMAINLSNKFADFKEYIYYK